MPPHTDIIRNSVKKVLNLFESTKFKKMFLPFSLHFLICENFNLENFLRTIQNEIDLFLRITKYA